MNNILQSLFIAFALIGVGHTFILIICNINKEIERKINIKYELGIVILIIGVILLDSFR